MHETVVELGRPARVLRRVAEQLDAELVVLGGKRHPALERWLGGSTALNAVRMLSVPVLITRDPAASFRRVLVGTDLSPATGPTIAAAQRFAGVFGARIRAVNVLEPLPAFPGAPLAHAPEYHALWEETLGREVWPLVTVPGAETVVRHGPVVSTLEREAADWAADLLVVGSHGKGWVDRMLLGSVTERLLNDLPTSLLVVPIGAQDPLRAERAHRAPRHAHGRGWLSRALVGSVTEQLLKRLPTATLVVPARQVDRQWAAARRARARRPRLAPA